SPTTPQQIKQWQSDPLMKWIWESYEISSKLYAEVDAMKSRSIDDAYYKAHIAIIGTRIQQAGIRLAGVLNELFKNGLVGDAAPLASAATPANPDKQTTVCDKVYSTKKLESGMVFLNLGGDYPNQKLSVVIRKKDVGKFSFSPEMAFKDKTICVTGLLGEYNGKAEIVVSEPNQIRIQ
ncbi:MAG: S1/P1 nuclease, partial [Chitinophaga rupis]